MRALLVTLALLASCSDSPDETLVENLRVLAVRVDPPVANILDFPTPVITITALTVHPDTEDLSTFTHTWSLELPDDVDTGGLDSLLPEGPYTNELVIDFANLGDVERGAEIEWLTAALPLRYLVESAEDHRNTIKLVNFLMPQIVEGDDDDSANDDDSADDDDSAAGPPPVPPTFDPPVPNEMPRITQLVWGDTTFEADDFPADDSPLIVPAVAEAGLEFQVHLADDADTEDVALDFFRTAGCSFLADPEGRSFGPPSEGCGDGPGFGFGGGGGFFGEVEDWSVRDLEWRPTPGETSAGARLFLVVRDAEGAQDWLEIRPE